MAGCPIFVGLRYRKMTGDDLGGVWRFLEDKVPLDGSVVSQILWTELREGLVRVVCANDLTRKWVEAQIAAS